MNVRHRGPAARAGSRRPTGPALAVLIATLIAACGAAASPSPAPSTGPAGPAPASAARPTTAPPATGSPAASTPAAGSASPATSGAAGSSAPATASVPSPAASATPSATPSAPPSSASATAPAACATGPTGPPAGAPASGATPPAIALQPVASGFAAPVGIVSARDGSGRIFVVEQGGLVRIVDADGTVLEQPFLDVRDRTNAGGERGLLGLAFHPQYACNGRFFIDYTDTDGNTVVAEYRVSPADPDRADPTQVARLLHIEQPYPNHNGGSLVFGPDGDLYVGMGDGGSAEDPQGNGQRLDTLLGKLLRIDVDHAAGRPYAIPAGNCAGCPAGALPEIFAYGLRNPWRFSFDRATGDLWIGDVGQDRWEEVDHLPIAAASGANFGWSTMEASHCLHGSSCDQRGLTLPVAEYGHGSGDCSVTGGYVYRGAAIPALQGWYLYSDYCSGRFRAVNTGTDRSAGVILDAGGNITSFGEDEAGELYVVDVSSGALARIVAAP